MWWEGFGGDRWGGCGAEPNAEADVLGPESNKQTSAAVVLTLLFGLGRYLVGYGCPIDVDGVVERVHFRRAASSSVSSSTSQPGLIRKYDTIDEEGEIFKGFTTTRLYMPVPGGHWLAAVPSSSSFTFLSPLPSCLSLKFAHPINIQSTPS